MSVTIPLTSTIIDGRPSSQARIDHNVDLGTVSLSTAYIQPGPSLALWCHSAHMPAADARALGAALLHAALLIESTWDEQDEAEEAREIAREAADQRREDEAVEAAMFGRELEL